MLGLEDQLKGEMTITPQSLKENAQCTLHELHKKEGMDQ